MTPVLPRAEIKLRGLHNVENLLAAIAAVWGRVPVEAMRQVAQDALVAAVGQQHRQALSCRVALGSLSRIPSM